MKQKPDALPSSLSIQGTKRHEKNLLKLLETGWWIVVWKNTFKLKLSIVFQENIYPIISPLFLFKDWKTDLTYLFVECVKQGGNRLRNSMPFKLNGRF